ncbi:C45 family autoproteolytic acyltransferase/hydrolase [Candidatus Thiothrix sp. Deng01]|uniref:C45 family autoproteolytic acyltransferase/hydrolase n=1 Tax=Candidatus Thiothrix phosphatis TaxID=3112415 RepID=A0ABU6CYZ1_9GAMM|nr:C45 family autoproteolytic acyltransferase/hydolase [Candidatus Thiothrix sp. Deng01]MEB4591303.1 C45 family autoproteolytic acyltransferase/hydrolase [Candidatus Thiothrix sp. Deng01]
MRMRPRARRAPAGKVLALSASLLFCPLAGLAAPPAKIPVIRINTSGLSPLAIGAETGRQAKALFPDIERRYDRYLASVVDPTRFASLRRQQLPQLLQPLDQEWQDAMQGVAGAWTLAEDSIPGDGRLSKEEYQVLNLLPELGLAMPDGVAFSVFGNASALDSPISGRNLEMPSTPELRSLQAVTVYADADNKTLATIGFAGILAVTTGFNDRGLFLSLLNAAPNSPYRQTRHLPKQATSIGFALRQALQQQNSADAAANRLDGKTYAFDHSILLADRHTALVQEYNAASNVAARRVWNSPSRDSLPWGRPNQLAAVDCLMLPTTPGACKDPKDNVRWRRLRELARFTPAQPAAVESVSTLLSDTANYRYEIFSPQTVQSLVFTPASNTLYLYAAPVNGGPPATPAHQPYPQLLGAPKSGHNVNINAIQLTWILLLAMLVLTVWLRYGPRLPRKHDNA